MDNKASPVEERALTNAIERAATIASINDSLDRNQLLSEQLKKASIDKRFAKTASAAFNKRLTVLIFKKTADEHKTDPFQLTDADTVYRLVAGEEPETKTAAERPFALATESNIEQSMEKAASAESKLPETLWEHRVAPEVVEKHISSLLDKHAHILFNRIKRLEKDTESLQKQASEIAAYFKQTEYDYDFSTAVNLHGDKLKNALKGHVPDYIQFEKTANYAIQPAKDIFRKIASLIQATEKLEEDKKALQEYATSLTEFGITAMRFGNAMQLAKSAALAPLQPLPPAPTHLANPPVPASANTLLPAGATLPVNNIDLANAQMAAAQGALAQALATQRQRRTDYNRIQDSTASNVTGDTLAFLGHAIPDVAIGGSAQLLAAATNLNKTVYDAGLSTLQNAYNLYTTGLGGVHPGEVLDADFLVRDRYHDRMMAWSDMTADPQFSMYPAEQVWDAVNKAMNMDLSLERPDRREVLRAYVGQLLAQNNRMSTADVAALATTLKSLGATGGNGVEMAAAKAEALPDKERKDMPELKDIMQGIKTDKLEDAAKFHQADLAAAEKEWGQNLHETFKNRDDEARRQLDSANTRADAARREADTAGRNLLKAIVDETQRTDRENERRNDQYQQALARTLAANARIQATNDTKQQKWETQVRNAVLKSLGTGRNPARVVRDSQNNPMYVTVPRTYILPNGSPATNGRLYMNNFDALVQAAMRNPAELRRLGVPIQP